MENEHLLATVGADGRLQRVTEKATGWALPVSADVLYYRSAAFEHERDHRAEDSYDFAANGTQAHPFPAAAATRALYVSGPLYRPLTESSSGSLVWASAPSQGSAPHID